MSDDGVAHPNLDERLAGMRQAPDDADLWFHAITLTADAQGCVSFGTHSEWVGFTDDTHRVELRQSRLVRATHAYVWENAKQPFVFVTCENDLMSFLVAGGNALVEKTIAEGVFPDKLEPEPSYPTGYAGFVGSGFLAPTALRRAPTPKLRMEVLKRDGRRCRICGRRPDDDTDIVLHVHHIRPWQVGGTTDESNLITLCHTCHSGLDPHYDPSLFGYIEQDDALFNRATFQNGVVNYRRIGFWGDPE